jgi:hypothetical protein
MRFSTEAIVALAVAVVFVLMSFGAIAREQGQGPARDGHNPYIAANNVSLSEVAAGETVIPRLYYTGTCLSGIGTVAVDVESA